MKALSLSPELVRLLSTPIDEHYINCVEAYLENPTPKGLKELTLFTWIRKDKMKLDKLPRIPISEMIKGLVFNRGKRGEK